MVQMRTRIMNQLQALAMNEGYRWKKKLFSEQGRALLEKLSLAPWASRRRQELLELLDRMNPTIYKRAVVVDAEKGRVERKISPATGRSKDFCPALLTLYRERP